MDFYVECMRYDGHRQGGTGTISSWVRAHEDDGCPADSGEGDR